MSEKLDRIVKISDLRTIWAHEAKDFTKWLAKEENLELLGEEIGIEIELAEVESSVGSFNVDIFASEVGTSRKIIIENQLEDTNHDHLGKIITYASGKKAEVIIWIVKRARDEHRQAIEWLNQHMDQNIGFFLVEIELWKIGDSKPAPKFNVVESPNDWAKVVKSNSELSTTKQLQYQFWNSFVDYAYKNVEFKNSFSQRKVYPQHWYDLAFGKKSYLISISVNTQKKTISSAIYIRNDKEIYNHFLNHKKEIEKELGLALTYSEATKDCRIVANKRGIIDDNDQWQSNFDWFIETSLKMKEVFSKYEI